MIAQVADKAQHPNAAKLFIRYICGEKNHDGKGLQPFLTAGSYPVFPDAKITAKMPNYDSIPKFPLDFDFYYDHFQDVSDYWISVQP